MTTFFWTDEKLGEKITVTEARLRLASQEGETVVMDLEIRKGGSWYLVPEFMSGKLVDVMLKWFQLMLDLANLDLGKRSVLKEQDVVGTLQDVRLENGFFVVIVVQALDTFVFFYDQREYLAVSDGKTLAFIHAKSRKVRKYTLDGVKARIAGVQKISEDALKAI